MPNRVSISRKGVAHQPGIAPPAAVHADISAQVAAHFIVRQAPVCQNDRVPDAG